MFNGGKVIEPVADSYANYTAMVEEYESTDVLIRNSEASRKRVQTQVAGQTSGQPVWRSYQWNCRPLTESISKTISRPVLQRLQSRQFNGTGLISVKTFRTEAELSGSTFAAPRRSRNKKPL